MKSRHQFNIEKIEGAIDSVLLHASTDAAYIEKAHQQFTKEAKLYPEGVKETLFNTWLIHHYVDARKIEKALENQPDCVDALNKASFSLYRAWRNKQYFIFEDVFTKRQFPMLAELYETIVDIDALCLGYIYHLDGENYLVGDFAQIATQHTSLIVKEVMNQYQYAKEQGAYTVEGFLQQTPLLLYWAVETFIVLDAPEPEEEYSVFEVTCTVGETGNHDALLGSPLVTESLIDGVYTLLLDGLDPIDFCIEGQRIVFDCATEEDAEGFRSWLEEEGSALNVVWLGTKKLTLDELIDDQEEPMGE